MTKMKKTMVGVLMMAAWLLPSMAFADSYSSLWKQWERAVVRDHPKTELMVLQKIADKATAERAYGHLLKAQVQAVNVQLQLSPDSLRSGVKRMEQLYAKALNTNSVRAAAYASVLGKAYDLFPDLCYDKADAETRSLLPLTRIWWPA